MPNPYYPPNAPRSARNRLLSGRDLAPSPEQQRANRNRLAEALLSVAPVTGEATSLRDAWQASGRGANALMGGDVSGALGDYGEMALALAGALPGVGMVGRAARRGRGAFELDYFGQPVRILENPSPQETKGFINRTKYKAARRIVDPDTGDTYIWDANDPAMHALVAEKLGIDPKRIQGDMIELD